VRVVLVDKTLGPRAVPTGFGGVVVAEPGVPFDVTPEIGGVAPGPWEPVAHDVPRQDTSGPRPGADMPDGWTYEPVPVTDDEGNVFAFRRRHLGSGLLAQEGIWAAAVEEGDI